MYIKRGTVRIKRKILDLRDVIANSKKFVLFKYEMPLHDLKLKPGRGRDLKC